MKTLVSRQLCTCAALRPVIATELLRPVAPVRKIVSAWELVVPVSHWEELFVCDMSPLGVVKTLVVGRRRGYRLRHTPCKWFVLSCERRESRDSSLKNRQPTE